jgi:hypothetical protein
MTPEAGCCFRYRDEVCELGKYKIFNANYPKVVTPDRFYRGSTVLTTTLSHVEGVGGLVSGLFWIPDGSRTSPSRGKSRDRSIRE